MDNWIPDEIARISALPCLCTRCVCRNGCAMCDETGNFIRCERCVRIEELSIDNTYAQRALHGHFGSI